MHTDYLNPALRQLRDQQVRFAPREKKIEQVNQAEKLLGELDPRRTYTYNISASASQIIAPGPIPT